MARVRIPPRLRGPPHSAKGLSLFSGAPRPSEAVAAAAVGLSSEPRRLGGVKEMPPAQNLGGQQRAFFLAIAEHDGELANWYLGARMALEVPTNPECLVHAAHSVRELM